MAILAPILGTVADHSGNKLGFLRACAVLIVVFTASLFLVGPGMIVAGVLLFIAANVGYQGSSVFIEAFLPELARRLPEDQIVVLNCSGRGDKDMGTIAQHI